jgi:hypothetical protein
MRPPEPFSVRTISASLNAVPVRHAGTRHTTAGLFLREPGNTVVRHVSPGSQTERTLVELRARLQALPWAHRFAWTDVASYHMTVFGCAIETARTPDQWPRSLPLDTPIDAVSDWLDSRLDGFAGPGPFTMDIHAVTPFGLTLTGATESDESVARARHDALAIAYDQRPPGHDTYAFHLTMAYLIDWLPDEMVETYEAAMAECTEWVRSRLPVVELGPPVFCSFDDMNWFEPLRVLPGTGLAPVVRRRHAAFAPPASV